jgi:hypothetical protein
METRSIDIDRRKYPDWLRYGPGPPMARPIMIIEVPWTITVDQLAKIKKEFIGKDYRIIMRFGRKK